MYSWLFVTFIRAETLPRVYTVCGGGCVVREAGDANVALAEYGDKGGIAKGRKACESDGRRRFLLASDNLFFVP